MIIKKDEYIEEKIEKLKKLLTTYICNDKYKPNSFYFLINDILNYVNYLETKNEILEGLLDEQHFKEFNNFLNEQELEEGGKDVK